MPRRPPESKTTPDGVLLQSSGGFDMKAGHFVTSSEADLPLSFFLVVLAAQKRSQLYKHQKCPVNEICAGLHPAESHLHSGPQSLQFFIFRSADDVSS
ncbi:unnamed protein product [Protopolystoma xenopodis]|uniref:Uncharacterized protein n=1 Tax=Protopolystoma xenopodis TaxID=117903 RepID=A0A448WLK4_9PLAT|nr:unnamed protein product [Protopolystoma xenopodis]